jgi:hypothetical protein
MTEPPYSNLNVADLEGFMFGSRDLALLLVGQYDVEAHLLAIEGVLTRNKQHENAVSESIKALDKDIRAYNGGSYAYQQHMEGEWLDTLHGTVFQGAAHSMSAIGMIAPFFESLFVAIFEGLRKKPDWTAGKIGQGERKSSNVDDLWNPHFIFKSNKRRNDVVPGIEQLLEYTALAQHMPSDLMMTLKAAFSYRNKMLHCGFEWPVVERQKFANLIKSEGWPEDWFTMATSNNEPWVFYMSDVFITHCLHTVDQVLDGVGNYMAKVEVK